MRRLLSTVLVVVLSAGAAQAGGTVQGRSFFSQHLNELRGVGVYLPEGYDPSGTRRYPVIYFLHGWGGNHMSYWYVLRPALDNLIGTGQIQACIMVTPNGWVAPYDGSLWTDSALYGDFDAYVASDVVAFVDANYRTLPTSSKRAVMGHSMGAIGSMTVGLLHADVFGAIACHSGYYNWDRIREDFRDGVLMENPGGPPYHFSYGTGTYTSALFMIAGGYSPNMQNPPTYVDYPLDELGNIVESVISRWMAHNPDVLAAALPPGSYPDIYFDCGDLDEFFMYPTNLDLAAAFTSLGVPYVFRPFGGGHDLTQTSLGFSLTFLDQAMNGPAAVESGAESWSPALQLSRNRPNPVCASTEIRFQMPASGRASLRILDAEGRVLETLLDGIISSGAHSVEWRPQSTAAGIYFYELRVDEARTARKLMVGR